MCIFGIYGPKSVTLAHALVRKFNCFQILVDTHTYDQAVSIYYIY